MSDNHLTISRTKDRRITLMSNEIPTEHFTFDSTEMRDSEAIHAVLTIRDPGDKYSVRFCVITTTVH